MPLLPGRKPFSQSIQEQPIEAIQGNAIVVIQPGSYNLRLGRATDSLPNVLPHCIARRHKRPEQVQQQDAWLHRPECLLPEAGEIHTEGLRSAEDVLQARPMSNGGYRQPTAPYDVAEMNLTSKAEVSEVLSTTQWTKTSQDQNFLVGNEALYVHPKDHYNLHWPIRRGKFNLHPGPSGSLSAVVQDLEDIWGWAIEKKLEIPRKDLKNYRAILLIPDAYIRQQVREMFSILLDRLGFSAAFIMQESVCATFGTGVSSACVVDVGDQKTSICCVEDGISQRNTRLTMDIGGSDITRCFYWLLSKAGFPYKKCSLSNRMDALFLQELKENFCHLDHDLCGTEQLHMQLRHPASPVVKYAMKAGDERILAPLAIFHPEMFGLQGEYLCHRAEKYRSDPTDPQDDDYLVQTMSRHEQAAKAVAARKRENAEQMNKTADQSTIDDPDIDDDDTMDQPDPSDMQSGGNTARQGGRSKEEEEEGVDISQGLIGLDQAIIQCIDKCETEDMKRRMYGSVIVVGGGLMFTGLQGWLQYLLWTSMPQNLRLTLEALEVFTQTKDLDPRVTCWKGASVVCHMDTTQELWIGQKEWQKHGIRVLRERAMLIW